MPELVTHRAPTESLRNAQAEELPGWQLLMILPLDVVVLSLLFRSGLGLIGLGLCAMSMSLLIGERERRRQAHQTNADHPRE